MKPQDEDELYVSESLRLILYAPLFHFLQILGQMLHISIKLQIGPIGWLMGFRNGSLVSESSFFSFSMKVWIKMLQTCSNHETSG
jgi:hypothetical protein